MSSVCVLFIMDQMRKNTVEERDSTVGCVLFVMDQMRKNTVEERDSTVG